jgi:hypothetical protein
MGERERAYNFVHGSLVIITVAQPQPPITLIDLKQGKRPKVRTQDMFLHLQNPSFGGKKSQGKPIYIALIAIQLLVMYDIFYLYINEDSSGDSNC